MNVSASVKKMAFGTLFIGVLATIFVSGTATARAAAPQTFGTNRSDVTTQYAAAKAVTDNGLRRPYALAFGTDGTLYVADAGAQRIVRFDSTGAALPAWGADAHLFYPQSIAVDGRGRAYVADTGNNRVVVFDKTGAVVATWGGFAGAVGIAVDSLGMVYVVDSLNFRIQKFDSAGHAVVAWGSYGIGRGQFYLPGGIAVAGNRVYVADTYNNRVQIFDTEGRYIAAWQDAQLTAPTDLSLAPNGTLYVASASTNRIVAFDPRGRAYGSITGGLDTPHGMATSNTGALYLADSNNHRIQRYDTAGRITGAWENPYCRSGACDPERSVQIG